MVVIYVNSIDLQRASLVGIKISNTEVKIGCLDFRSSSLGYVRFPSVFSFLSPDSPRLAFLN